MTPRRSTFLNILRGSCIALAAITCATSAIAQDGSTQTRAPIEVSIDEFLDLARAELAAGRPEVALALMDGILETRPDLHAAKLIRIDALRRLGENAIALSAAKAAWRATPDDNERTRIARLAAIEHYRAGSTLASKIWLRRALETAQDPRTRANIIRNYNEIRRFEPWKTEFSFGLSPSTNLNNGAQGDVRSVDGLSTVDTLDGINQALSGLRAHVSGEMRYRWRTDEGLMLSAGVKAYNSFSFLSQDAQALAPDARNSDYSIATRDLFFALAKPLSKTKRLDFDVSLGRVHSAHEPYSDVFKTGLSMGMSAKNGVRHTHGVDLRYEKPVDVASAPSRSIEYRYDRTKTHRNSGTWRQSFAAETLLSDNERAANSNLGFTLGFDRQKPILGMKASFSLGARYAHFPDYYVATPISGGAFLIEDVPGGRRDATLYGGARFTLIEQSYMGFAPEISLNVGQTWSNVSRFDTQVLSVGLGLTSTF